MLTAQAFRFLCISVTLGLSGCVTQSGEAGSGTRNVLCQEGAVGPSSYISSGAPWDLSPSSMEGGNIQGYRQRLEQDARTKRQRYS